MVALRIRKVFLNEKPYGFARLYKRDLLDIYIGTDEHIIKEEDLPLLWLQDLSPFAIHSLDKRLAEDQWPLLQVQLLKRDTEIRSEALKTASQRPSTVELNAWRT